MRIAACRIRQRPVLVFQIPRREGQTRNRRSVWPTRRQPCISRYCDRPRLRTAVPPRTAPCRVASRGTPRRRRASSPPGLPADQRAPRRTAATCRTRARSHRRRYRLRRCRDTGACARRARVRARGRRLLESVPASARSATASSSPTASVWSTVPLDVAPIVRLCRRLKGIEAVSDGRQEREADGDIRRNSIGNRRVHLRERPRKRRSNSGAIRMDPRRS